MTAVGTKGPFEIFSTCPPIRDIPREAYLERVREVARWSDRSGCRGILVYTDNSQLDPWLVSQIVIQNTSNLSPLVAIQPAYMHPYTVAKMVATFGHLYQRRFYLNMVAGGFLNDLAALNDRTPHDKRYERLGEYTCVIKELLRSPSPVSFSGEFYKVERLQMTPSLSPGLFPGIFISGSSASGLAAAQSLGATPIRYPKPSEDCEEDPAERVPNSGVRVGIIARQTDANAWQVAHERFPEDRKGQLMHQLAMKVSDSLWHRQLSRLENEKGPKDSPYWMVPFENYKTFCPYLVGSYERVAKEIARYRDLGSRTFILDIPVSEEDLQHTSIAFGLAARGEIGVDAERATLADPRAAASEKAACLVLSKVV